MFDQNPNQTFLNYLPTNKLFVSVLRPAKHDKGCMRASKTNAVTIHEKNQVVETGFESFTPA